MRRILILSASIGLGHYRAGQALAHAFEPIDSVEVLHEDALKYANAAFRNLYAKSYADLVDKRRNYSAGFMNVQTRSGMKSNTESPFND